MNLDWMGVKATILRLRVETRGGYSLNGPDTLFGSGCSQRMKRIVNIMDRLQQGLTEANFCRAEDQLTYVVKCRRRARPNALIGEWIAGRIGQMIRLPIPPIEMLYLQPALAALMVNKDGAALAEAPNFGSQFVESAVEFASELNDQVNEDLRAKVLFFDWWIRNEDRSDGNTNLLWVAHEKSLWVIDHNNAFDNTFDIAKFWQNHIFRASRHLWDAEFRAQILIEMQRIMLRLPDFWVQLPSEWTDQGGALTLQDVETMLRRFEESAFWEIP